MESVKDITSLDSPVTPMLWQQKKTKKLSPCITQDHAFVIAAS